MFNFLQSINLFSSSNQLPAWIGRLVTGHWSLATGHWYPRYGINRNRRSSYHKVNGPMRPRVPAIFIQYLTIHACALYIHILGNLEISDEEINNVNYAQRRRAAMGLSFGFSFQAWFFSILLFQFTNFQKKDVAYGCMEYKSPPIGSFEMIDPTTRMKLFIGPILNVSQLRHGRRSRRKCCTHIILSCDQTIKLDTRWRLRL